MKTEKILYGQEEFLKIDLEPVYQKENVFFIGKIPASDILKVYTVRPTQYDLKKYSSFAKSFVDDKEYYDYLAKQDEEQISSKDFQREADKGRVSDIARFLNTEEYAFFPNTIIATCELINDYEELSLSEESSFDDFVNHDSRPRHLSFLNQNGESYCLFIPFVESSLLVIDGQHRLKGLEKADTTTISNYEVLVSFMIGFDRSVIAGLFYTINYEQKSVNKSLLYHLTGEFSSELNELTFLHNTVKLLNELDNSPFYGKIKMLGVAPKNASKEEKDKLSLSQSFLIDYLIKTISKTAINANLPPIFLYYYQREEKQIEIIRFIIRYFNAVKEIKSFDWQHPTESILTKGMGIGALIRVMQILYVKLFIEEWRLDPEKITTISKEELRKKLSGLANIDFSNEGEFGGVGSGGTINKLTQRIVENLSYLTTDDYAVFFDTYKQQYLNRFKSWLKNNIK